MQLKSLLGILGSSSILLSTALPTDALTLTSSFKVANPAILDADILNNPTQTDFDLTTPFTGLTAPISNVQVTISSLTHPNVSQLELYLISPNNEILNLFLGSSGANFTNTVFDDSGSNYADSGTAPFTGTFKPSGKNVGNMSNTGNGTFLGTFAQNPNGNWTLRIYDTVNGQTGTLNSASLSITATPLPVPFEFESTLGLGIMGGIWGLQQWRKQWRRA